ncbi:MAG: nucleotide exchange factor GrpE [Candidatus Cloacimonetes bacterium]|nr:nucleotide exchange factor GrpE [Candidatus Cloacimonadota bacterium]
MSKKQHHESKAEAEMEAAAIETEAIDKMTELQQEVLDWKDKYMRNMAEFENFRKRSNQEKADWIRMATQKFALEICDVADNFERAMLQANEQELLSSFGKGVVMIEKQLRQAMEKEGVKKIEALGEEFDPAYHDALAHIPSDYEENTIAAIIQNGYTMNDKLLRPARVAVSSGNNINIKSLEE